MTECIGVSSKKRKDLFWLVHLPNASAQAWIEVALGSLLCVHENLRARSWGTEEILWASRLLQGESRKWDPFRNEQ